MKELAMKRFLLSLMFVAALTSTLGVSAIESIDNTVQARHAQIEKELN
jgi:hypothetical protein